MPLPTDEALLALSQDVLQQFDALFGLHPGFRPAHAKGTMLQGTFTPTPSAATLTRAPHLTRPSTPVTVRFSNSTGLQAIPDNDPNADPRGMAIRFHLGERVHTDIVGHSTDGFPTRTGAEFLDLLKAIAATQPTDAHPNPVRTVPRHAPGRPGVRADAQAGAVQLRTRGVLRRDGNALHQ